MTSSKLVLYFISLFALIAIIRAVPVSLSEAEAEKTENCQKLCGHCGCMGFYCGDECICECNNQEDEDLKCVATMQSNCQKLKLPFEVLIQGPSGNRFVRSLLAADTDAHALLEDLDAIDRRSRSTISIYKPEDQVAESTDEFYKQIDQEPEQREHEILSAKTEDESSNSAYSQATDAKSARKPSHAVFATLSEDTTSPSKRQAIFDFDLGSDTFYRSGDMIKRDADTIVGDALGGEAVGSPLNVDAALEPVVGAPHAAHNYEAKVAPLRTAALLEDLRKRSLLRRAEIQKALAFNDATLGAPLKRLEEVRNRIAAGTLLQDAAARSNARLDAIRLKLPLLALPKLDAIAK